MTCGFQCFQLFYGKGQENCPLFAPHSILVTSIPGKGVATQRHCFWNQHRAGVCTAR